VFVQILDSSLAEDYVTRHVFMDFLVLANSAGDVDMTVEALARRTNIPIDILRVSISKLCAPDKTSRSPDMEGRRLVPLDDHRDWGWRIVNYKGYRDVRDENARRDYMRTYMQKRRAAEKARKQAVNRSKQSLAHAEAYAEAEEEGEERPPAAAPESASLRATAALLAGEFKSKAEWRGGTGPIVNCFMEAMQGRDALKPENISQAINETDPKFVQPGMKPWTLLDRFRPWLKQALGK